MQSLTRGARKYLNCILVFILLSWSGSHLQKTWGSRCDFQPCRDMWWELRWEYRYFLSCPVLQEGRQLITWQRAPPTRSRGARMRWWGERAHSRYWHRKTKSDSGKEVRKDRGVGVSRRHTHTVTHPSNLKGTQLLASSPPPNMSVNLLECSGRQANTQRGSRKDPLPCWSTQSAPLRSTNSRGGAG